MRGPAFDNKKVSGSGRPLGGLRPNRPAVRVRSSGVPHKVQGMVGQRIERAGSETSGRYLKQTGPIGYGTRTVSRGSGRWAARVAVLRARMNQSSKEPAAPAVKTAALPKRLMPHEPLIRSPGTSSRTDMKSGPPVTHTRT